MKISKILGFSKQGARVSAHETHFGTIGYDEQGQARHVIFKRNKYLGPKGKRASELEACFTAITNTLISPTHVLRQDIVTNEYGNVVGVCAEHAAHALLRIQQQQPGVTFLRASKQLPIKEVGKQQFQEWLAGFVPASVEATQEKLIAARMHYNQRLQNYWQERKNIGELPAGVDLDEEDYVANPALGVALQSPEQREWKQLKGKCAAQTESNVQQEVQIAALGKGSGYNFLDELPQNFFARLMEAKKDGQVTVDMDSLAEVFTTAYGLEEDDLHKGNIGYYVTEEAGKPCFHFFKIDHDLMFSDKVMAARGGARFANWGYSEQRFQISAADLLGFPDLQYSGNHYWPTKKVLFAKGEKAYHNNMDRQAYKDLKHDADFQHAKWRRFLKQVVIPHDLVTKSLNITLDAVDKTPETASTLALVHRATDARMGELRMVLLQLPEFCEFLIEHRERAMELIRVEISEYARMLGCSQEEQEQYQHEIKGALDSMVRAAELSGFESALHTAVRTQTYRLYDSVKYFKNSLNSKDAEGNTVLDVALNHYKTYTELRTEGASEKERAYGRKMQTYYADVIGDLKQHKARYSKEKFPEFTELMQEINTVNSISKLPVVTCLDEFKRELAGIQHHPMQTLRQDKEYALALLDKAKLSKAELLQLKQELRPTEPAAPLKFIKQLRSEIWIVRLIRGAYGSTTTSSKMNDLIERKINALTCKSFKDAVPKDAEPDATQLRMR